MSGPVAIAKLGMKSLRQPRGSEALSRNRWVVINLELSVLFPRRLSPTGLPNAP